MRPHRIPKRFRTTDQRFVGGNRVELLRDGVETYPSMLAAIRAAERQVLFEMYWFDSDRTGREFATALAEAAARGVEVAVLYDAVGSIGTRLLNRRDGARGSESPALHPLSLGKIAFDWPAHPPRSPEAAGRGCPHRFTGGINIAMPGFRSRARRRRLA